MFIPSGVSFELISRISGEVLACGSSSDKDLCCLSDDVVGDVGTLGMLPLAAAFDGCCF